MSGMSRLFIVDPMCVLNYGHNPQSLVYYADYFSARSFKCIPVSCRYFQSEDKKYSSFKKHFGYYYEDFVKLPPHVNVSADIEEYVHELSEAGGRVGEANLTDDVLLNQAILDWSNLLEAEHIDSEDFIFYPSVDYYGAVGLLHNLRMLPPAQRPSTHLRFIGVMENARVGGGDIIKVIRSYLNSLQDCVTVSAEAPVYSAYLQSRFRCPVLTTVYPPYGELIPRVRKKDDPFIVLSAGAGREDKGFLRLRNIVEQYSKKFPSDNVIFQVQNLRPQDEARYVSYVAQLYASHNVILTPAIQTDAEMVDGYRNSDMALLPYDFETYRFRGSAVFMESLLFGRPFVISRKTGFEPFVPLYETAASVTADIEFADHINKIYQMDPDQLAEKCFKSRLAFIDFSHKGLGAVFAGA